MSKAGALPLNLYLIPRRFTKETFISTSAIAFAAVNLIKLPPYLWLGEINRTSAWASLALVSVAWAGVKCGLWLQHRSARRSSTDW
ncbi:hypothetical protein [Halomonas sp. BM-2019]|uniref:hypothetical protein n=1 Tax=Halomonas sp. BM-2019 TaxID=2811227 RepID=UPI0031FDE387